MACKRAAAHNRVCVRVIRVLALVSGVHARITGPRVTHCACLLPYVQRRRRRRHPARAPRASIVPPVQPQRRRGAPAQRATFALAAPHLQSRAGAIRGITAPRRQRPPRASSVPRVARVRGSTLPPLPVPRAHTAPRVRLRPWRALRASGIFVPHRAPQHRELSVHPASCAMAARSSHRHALREILAREEFLLAALACLGTRVPRLQPRLWARCARVG